MSYELICRAYILRLLFQPPGKPCLHMAEEYLHSQSSRTSGSLVHKVVFVCVNQMEFISSFSLGNVTESILDY